MKSGVLFLVSLALAAGSAAAQTPAPSRPGGDVVAPRVLKEVKPSYTADALRQRISGVVKMDCVVLADGTVGEVRVIESLDPSLDEAAVAALKQWRFAPGTRKGVAVPVIVEVEMSFTTGSDPKLDSADVFKPGGGVTMPRIVSETKPEYPREVMADGIQGSVMLECVVLPSGRVGDIRVKKSLDLRLDEAARQALSRWRFAPGTREGKPVPVQVEVEMTFTAR